MSFVFDKLLWIVGQPANGMLLVLSIGFALLVTRWRRAGLLVAGGAAAAMLAVAIIPIGDWLLSPLENRFAATPVPERIDGIIVLGGAVDPVLSASRGQPVLNDGAERLTAFVALARRHPEARLAFTGGSGRLTATGLKEAGPARDLLRSLGIAAERVVWEDQSRTTAENARLARRAVRPVAGETWLLVTSARHMPRAVGAFRAAGWPVVAHPTDFLTPVRPRLRPRFDLAQGLALVNAAAREWIGLLVYRLRGDTMTLLPAVEPRDV